MVYAHCVFLDFSATRISSVFAPTSKVLHEFKCSRFVLFHKKFIICGNSLTPDLATRTTLQCLSSKHKSAFSGWISLTILYTFSITMNSHHKQTNNELLNLHVLCVYESLIYRINLCHRTPLLSKNY